MDPTLNYLAAAAIAFVSGTGGWATLQLVINRRGRKAEAARTQAEAEVKREEVKRTAAERRKMLEDAQETAQRVALESSERSLTNMTKDLISCRQELEVTRLTLKKRGAQVDDLIDAFEAYMEVGDTSESKRVARLAIRKARAEL